MNLTQRCTFLLIALAPVAVVAAPSEASGLMPCPAAVPAWVDHYATLAFRESPYEDLVGTHRLPEAVARQRNHYRFAYDDAGRLIRVSFVLGDQVRALDHTANVLMDTPDVEICYPDGMEVRHFRDAYGNPVYSRGNVAEERYRLDERGYRQSLTFHDADGRGIENGWGITRYRWERQRDGSVIETRVDADGEPAEIRPGFPFYRVRLSFGAGGWLALMQNIDDAGRLVRNSLDAAEDQLEYAANGDMIAWNVFDEKQQRSEGNSPRVARGVREFTREGMERIERYEDRHGKAMRNAYGFRNTEATFDRFGNMLSRFSRDEANAKTANPETGYAGYALRWDASGRHRIGIRYIAANGEPANHVRRGYHRIEEIHDAAGDRVEVRFLDEQGDLVNRLDNGVAREVHTYDNRHRRLSQAFFDRDGKPVVVNGSTERRWRYRADGYPEPAGEAP